MRGINLATMAMAALGTAAAVATDSMKSFSEALPKPEDAIPDHVSIERHSPHFWPGYKKLGVKIDGAIRRSDVVEFCVSEGWAMVQVKNAMGVRVPDPATNGRTFLLERVTGKIEPYWIAKDQRRANEGDAARLAAAETKRQMRADKLRRIAERNAARV